MKNASEMETMNVVTTDKYELSIDNHDYYCGIAKSVLVRRESTVETKWKH